MQRTVKYVAIWLGATVVAISVSWFAVRGVLRSDFVADVIVRPMAARTETARNTATLPSPTTPIPSATPAPTPTAGATPTPDQTKRVPASTPAPERAKDLRRVEGADDNVTVVTVRGGSAVFLLDGKRCELVSVTPNAGHVVQISRRDGWIRVDFARGAHGSSAFCIGAEHRTDSWEY